MVIIIIIIIVIIISVIITPHGLYNKHRWYIYTENMLTDFEIFDCLFDMTNSRTALTEVLGSKKN